MRSLLRSSQAHSATSLEDTRTQDRFPASAGTLGFLAEVAMNVFVKCFLLCPVTLNQVKTRGVWTWQNN